MKVIIQCKCGWKRPFTLRTRACMDHDISLESDCSWPLAHVDRVSNCLQWMQRHFDLSIVYSALGMEVRSIVISVSVCLSVCLSASISQQPRVQSLYQIFCRPVGYVSHVVAARSSSGGVAIRYVRPFLQSTSCFPEMGPMAHVMQVRCKLKVSATATGLQHTFYTDLARIHILQLLYFQINSALYHFVWECCWMLLQKLEKLWVFNQVDWDFWRPVQRPICISHHLLRTMVVKNIDSGI